MASERDILYQAELQKVGKSGNKTSEVVVSENHVRWKEKEETASGKRKESSDAAEVKVRISWILKISVEENSTDTNQSKLCIHHAARNLNKDFTSDLSLAEVTFIGAKETCSKLAELLQNQITKKAPNRPKRLLLIINPVSGKGKGEKIYQHQVAPIFDLSGIKVDVKVTQRSKHSDEILDQYDLSTVDAVIAMGGDGTLTEVASALMRRTAKDAGIDEDDPDVTLKTPSITCSMISAGSANGHPLYSGFSKLPTTSALVIAIGHTQSMDVVSIHCGRKLIAYDLLLLGYGQMGRVMSMMENNRWAGPARYLALPFCLLLSRKTIEVEVNLLHAETSGENQNATEDKSNEGTTDGATAGPAWQTVSGELLSVDMTTINPASPQYHKPFFIQQNLGDGVMNVWLSRPCGRMDQIAFFNKLKKMDHTAFDVDFIDKYAVKAYKVRATGKHSQDSKEAMVLVWDGDMISLPEPHAEIRNHQGVMTIFSRDDGEELRSSHANQPKPA